MEEQIYKLRHITEIDLDLVLDWRNSNRVRRYMYNDRLISPSEHFAWYSRLQNDSSIVFLIFEINQTPVGIVNFSEIDHQNMNCQMGFYLGRDDLPKGTGTKMGELALKYAFQKMRIRKISGEVLAFNEPSRHFFSRLGFRQEGQLVQHVLKDGIFADVIIYGLLRDEYLQKQRNTMGDRNESN